jgi:hypothetical protein
VLELWRDDKRQDFEQFLDEVDRHLHNFVASVATLRDHTRRVWNKHAPAQADMQAEYKRRITETFAESPLASFVQQLRNYTLHRRLPIAQGTLSWQRDEAIVSRVVLVKGELARWEKWPSTARQFLDEGDGDIDLLDVITGYAAKVASFNDWFGRAFVASHLPAFDELTRLENELAAASASTEPPPHSGQ